MANLCDNGTIQRPWGRERLYRRRGSVLILVMALLGILFVTGMTFLATMNFEAGLIAIERETDNDEVGVDLVESVTEQVLRESLVVIPGMMGNMSSLGGVNPDTGLFQADRLTWAELPVVHSLLAQIEPYWRDDPFTAGFDPELVFDHFTDFEALETDPADLAYHPIADSQFRVIRTAWANGIEVDLDPDPYRELMAVPVDSDGDGIVDTFAAAFGEGGVALSSSQLALLAKLVNAPSNPTGRVFAGVRVIPHGGMVNLSESHPCLIANVFGINLDELPQTDPQTASGWRPYSPLAEEASLRRRSLLPPRVLSPTAIQGDPHGDDPDGTGDFTTYLFPEGDPSFPDGESVETGQHRYFPFSINDAYDTVWVDRMDPELSSTGRYDRRHLVTTISYDDLLSRGGWLEWGDNSVTPPVILETDILSLMKDANEKRIEAKKKPSGVDWCPDPWASPPTFLPFEYADYPHTIPNGYYDPGDGTDVPYTWCDCNETDGCDVDNVRKGRLRLSLPWLDEAVYPNPDDSLEPGAITAGQRVRLIQDAFTMLLLNARSDYWGAYQGVDENDNGNIDPDEWVWQIPGDRLKEIERTAAALTANLLDFADGDDDPTDDLLDDPTRVELRSADYRNLDKFGREYDQFDTPETAEFVFGLECQPYITEVTAYVVAMDTPYYAVELFNPYEGEIKTVVEGETVYKFSIVDAAGNQSPPFHLSEPVPGGGYLVIHGGSVGGAPPLPEGTHVEDIDNLAFGNGDTIYLTRDVDYDVGSGGAETIVVDQFTVAGDNIAKANGPDPGLWSMERASVSTIPYIDASGQLVSSPWFAPIPTQVECPNEGEHSLGEDSAYVPAIADLRPVEVLFANDDSVTRALSNAFPTTGSLLLLMRYGNRSFLDVTSEPKLAFTASLVGSQETVVYDALAGGKQNVDVERNTEIDNGHMPVFDVGRVHHVDPALNPIPAAGGSTTYPPWDTERPGELWHLPWGQLVFDYFTALPLSSEGPYPWDTNSPAQPRVDLDGLRVHGRININAAPWKVLSGLPFVPMEKIPAPFRPTIRNALGLVEPSASDPMNPTVDELIYQDHESTPLDDPLAQAIVAYREVREIEESGDYSQDRTGRGWDVGEPGWRRGTGFLAVGELANVRHAAAAKPASQTTDAGHVDSGGTYLEAIAVLAALGDWVTVRSHVFTVYGAIRGEPTPGTSEGGPEVDARAIRFQETVDRLPTFLGEPAPARIGERVLTSYQDIRND